MDHINDISNNMPEKAFRVLIGHRKRRNAIICIDDIEQIWKRHRSDSKDTFENFITETKNDLSTK